MRTIGFRELRTHARRILRSVINRGKTVEVTHRDRPIARIAPVVAQSEPEPDGSDVWTDIDRVAAEIAQRWPAGVSAVDAVREGRRDL